ncbi:MAG: NADH-quinone oxidoreductase subunit K [Candidatus Cloacimonetes bacterium]|nr:NADH-quinone oxidoreductase subunit K [Candidatus Cloacimonadota bacterium]
MIVYILCFLLFLIGLYGVVVKRNLIKIIISLAIMEYSVNLFLIMVGYISAGQAPIINEEVSRTGPFVDPLPQAMILTAIVIGLATTSLLLAIAIRLYGKYGTFDIRKINHLKG